MGISWQSLENPGMKAALGMPKGLTGVFITKTEPMFEASHVLRAGDVLTSFNGEGWCEFGVCLFSPSGSASKQVESFMRMACCPAAGQ
jgi:hypothetical protein